MTNPDKVFGRLGNRLFQMAALYSHAKDLGTDLYFQDPKYFEKNKDEIRKLFSDDIGLVPHVSIHVRRGANPANPDEPKYHENPFYIDLCNTDYYERAIAMFLDSTFLVFSDDLEWCKKKWGNDKRFEVVEGNDEITDLNLMASCEHNIIANSSFSWWAAYLNQHPNKIVFAPIKWYADGVERTKCPDDWIRI